RPNARALRARKQPAGPEQDAGLGHFLGMLAHGRHQPRIGRVAALVTPALVGVRIELDHHQVLHRSLLVGGTSGCRSAGWHFDSRIDKNATPGSGTVVTMVAPPCWRIKQFGGRERMKRTFVAAFAAMLAFFAGCAGASSYCSEITDMWWNPRRIDERSSRSRSTTRVRG